MPDNDQVWQLTQHIQRLLPGARYLVLRYPHNSGGLPWTSIAVYNDRGNVVFVPQEPLREQFTHCVRRLTFLMQAIQNSTQSDDTWVREYNQLHLDLDYTTQSRSVRLNPDMFYQSALKNPDTPAERIAQIATACIEPEIHTAITCHPKCPHHIRAILILGRTFPRDE